MMWRIASRNSKNVEIARLTQDPSGGRGLPPDGIGTFSAFPDRLPRPWLLHGAALGLLGLCVFMALWLPAHFTRPAGMHLPDDSSSFTFEDRKATALLAIESALAGRAAVLDNAPGETPEGVPGTFGAASEEGIIPVATETMHPGDPPMPQFHALGLSVTLAAALVAVPQGFAEDPPAKPQATDPPTLEQVLREIRKTGEAVARIETKVGPGGELRKELDTLTSQLDRLQIERGRLDRSQSDTQTKVQQLQVEADKMHDRIRALEVMIEDLKIRTPGKAAEPLPRGDGSVMPREARRLKPSPTGPGSIRIKNTYAYPVTVTVNGRAHTVDSQRPILLENQAAGWFTYEVRGIQSPTARWLDAGEQFTIHVYPLNP